MNDNMIVILIFGTIQAVINGSIVYFIRNALSKMDKITAIEVEIKKMKSIEHEIYKVPVLEEKVRVLSNNQESMKEDITEIKEITHGLRLEMRELLQSVTERNAELKSDLKLLICEELGKIHVLITTIKP